MFSRPKYSGAQPFTQTTYSASSLQYCAEQACKRWTGNTRKPQRRRPLYISDEKQNACVACGMRFLSNTDEQGLKDEKISDRIQRDNRRVDERRRREV
jgi:hypothetical protein